MMRLRKVDFPQIDTLMIILGLVLFAFGLILFFK